MRTSALVRISVLLTLLAIVGAFALHRHPGLLNNQLLAPQPLAASIAPPSAAATFRADRSTAWVPTYNDPQGVDIFTPLPNDATGLHGNWNAEISDCTRRLAQTWAAMGGKPFSSGKYWNNMAAVRRRGWISTSYKSFTVTSATQIASELKARKVLQIETIKGPSSSTLAHARLIDPAKGTVAAEWETTAPGISYEALFDAEVELAAKIAATLCGVPDRDALVAKIRSTPISQADMERATRDSATARQLLASRAAVDVLNAARLAIDATQRAPACVDAWIAATMAFQSLAGQIAGSETQTWRDLMVRAMAAGEIAYALDPQDPFARFARGLGIAATGRYTQAMKLADAELAAHPQDPVAQAWRSVLYQNTVQFPASAPNGKAGEIIAILAPSNDLDAKPDVRDNVYKKWLEREPYSSGVWLEWGNDFRDRSQLGYQRMCHTAAAATGALLAMNEIVRQLEESGKTAEARQAANEALTAIGAAECGSTTGTLTQCFEERARAWCRDKGGYAAKEIWWKKEDVGFKLLTLYSEWNNRIPTLLPDHPGIAPACSGIAFTPKEWIELTQRFALDGAAESVGDLGLGLGVDEALDIGNSLEKLFPRDLAILNAITSYHYYAHFDNTKVDEYDRKIGAQDFLYGPRARRQAGWMRGDLAVRTRAYEELKYKSPFHYKTLSYIAESLEKIENYPAAADHYELLNTRYPMNYSCKLDALYCRAISEDRLIAEAEVAQLEVQLPKEYPTRDYLLARGYWCSGNANRALEFFTKVLADATGNDTNPNYRVAFLYKLQGNTTAAVEALDAYVKRDPSSLTTCEVLLEISRVYERAGDLQAARAAWERAASVDNWKYTVVARGAWLAYRFGNTSDALAEYKRNCDRYPGNTSSGDLAAALLATGDEEGALKACEDGLRLGNSERSSYAMKATIQRRRGDLDGAVKTLQAYNGRMIDDPKPAESLAAHYWIAGDMRQALDFAKAQLDRSGGGAVDSALELLGQMYVEAGELEPVDKIIRKLRARNPMDVTPDMLTARLALARGETSAAVVALARPLKIGGDDVWGLAAKVYLAAGDPAKSLEYARRARESRLLPGIECLMVEGEACKALGKIDEAKKAWTECTKVQGPKARFAIEAAKKLQSM